MNTKLDVYIQESRKQGADDEQIKSNLLQAGWSISDIDLAFAGDKDVPQIGMVGLRQTIKTAVIFFSLFVVLFFAFIFSSFFIRWFFIFNLFAIPVHLIYALFFVVAGVISTQYINLHKDFSSKLTIYYVSLLIFSVFAIFYPFFFIKKIALLYLILPFKSLFYFNILFSVSLFLSSTVLFFSAYILRKKHVSIFSKSVYVLVSIVFLLPMFFYNSYFALQSKQLEGNIAQSVIRDRPKESIVYYTRCTIHNSSTDRVPRRSPDKKKIAWITRNKIVIEKIIEGEEIPKRRFGSVDENKLIFSVELESSSEVKRINNFVWLNENEIAVFIPKDLWVIDVKNKKKRKLLSADMDLTKPWYLDKDKFIFMSPKDKTVRQYDFDSKRVTYTREILNFDIRFSTPFRFSGSGNKLFQFQSNIVEVLGLKSGERQIIDGQLVMDIQPFGLSPRISPNGNSVYYLDPGKDRAWIGDDVHTIYDINTAQKYTLNDLISPLVAVSADMLFGWWVDEDNILMHIRSTKSDLFLVNVKEQSYEKIDWESIVSSCVI